jgi:hypothetical protein
VGIEVAVGVTVAADVKGDVPIVVGVDAGGGAAIDGAGAWPPVLLKGERDWTTLDVQVRRDDATGC